MEGVWETHRNVPFTLFGFPDEDARVTHGAVEIPSLASLILTHDIDGEIKGLNEFRGEHPPVAAVFWAFRIMVGIGVLMLVVAWWLIVRMWRTGELLQRHYKALSAMTFSGWIAVLAGWYVTEIGRQPWIVQGLVRVEEVAAAHGDGIVLSTLILYLSLYLFLLASYIGALRYLSSKPAPVINLRRAGEGIA